ncbi:MAG: right-handed parallel beta-helix repeat-containing protein [Noviherbaspirillum sp.]
MPAHQAAFPLPALRLALACALGLYAMGCGAASLPPEPVYKGELTGDGKGGVMVRPFTLPEARSDSGQTQEAAPAQRTPQAERKPQAQGRPQVIPQAEPEPQRGPSAGPVTLEVGPGQKIRTIAQAAKLARSGDTILVEAGVYSGDVAVFTQDQLTIRVRGGRARLNASGAHAEGKGIWVVRGGHIVVENFEFVGARVPDHNGAGIRFEKGRLVLRNCLFRDNENGILTSGNKQAELEIENSEFDRNGTENGRGHQLYVGEIAALKVSGSYFHHAVGGHLLKSRAAISTVMYNRLSDENGGQASYEMEFPNGGQAYVVGNIIEQSATTQNSAIVVAGLEGYRWPKNELYLVNNTIIDDRAADGIFLRTAPGMQVLKAMNNLLVGERKRDFGIFSGDMKNTLRDAGKSMVLPDLGTRQGDDGMKAEVRNNFNPAREEFAQAAQLDYRLRERSPLAGKYLAPGSANGVDLTPRAEYAHPAQTRRLSTAPMVPGALQSVAR